MFDEQKEPSRLYLPWPRDRVWREGDAITIAGQAADLTGWVHNYVILDVELDEDIDRNWAWLTLRQTSGTGRIVPH